jgi:hypothetical protein
MIDAHTAVPLVVIEVGPFATAGALEKPCIGLLRIAGVDSAKAPK